MSTEFLLLFILLLAVLVYLIADKFKAQRPASTSEAVLLDLVNELKQQLNQNGLHHQQLINDRLDDITRQLATHQQFNTRQLLEQQQQSASLMHQITGKLVHIEDTNQQVLSMTAQMRGLERLFASPKQRGIIGEFLLDSLLSHVLPPNQFQLQYRFRSGVVVDAAIFFKDKIIPIDAKFPMEQYKRLENAEHIQQKKLLDKQFRVDLKARIDETAKYVLLHENTTNFALMFVPAEGVYHYLLQYSAANSNDPQHDLVVYAFQKKVIIVSPSTFYAYLETVLHGLKALQIEESVKDVLQKVTELQRHLYQYEEHFLRLGKQLQSTQTTYDQARREFDRIDKAVTNINQLPPTNPNKLF